MDCFDKKTFSYQSQHNFCCENALRTVSDLYMFNTSSAILSHSQHTQTQTNPPRSRLCCELLRAFHVGKFNPFLNVFIPQTEMKDIIHQLNMICSPRFILISPSFQMHNRDIEVSKYLTNNLFLLPSYLQCSFCNTPQPSLSFFDHSVECFKNTLTSEITKQTSPIILKNNHLQFVYASYCTH